MSVMPLDTHKYFKLLTAAGLTETQAEPISSGIWEGVTDTLATKDDLHLLRADLQGDMENLRAEVKADMSSLRAEVRADMSSLRAEMKADMSSLQAEMKADMSDLRAEMFGIQTNLQRWMIGSFVAQTGLLVAIIKLF